MSNDNPSLGDDPLPEYKRELDEPDRADAPAQITVGLIADPGMPARTANTLVEKLPPLLSQRIDSSVEWNVTVSAERLSLDENDVVSLNQDVAAVKTREEWQVAVYLTDLPRFADNRVVVADVNIEQALAIVSFPALGGGLSHRTRAVVMHTIGKMYAAETSGSARAGRGRQLKGLMTPAEGIRPQRKGIDTYISIREPQGSARLLIGMVLSNRPWRLVKELSSAIAAAAATGAFGIFYASIAQLSDGMGKPRLALVTVVVAFATTIWLIVHNRLWEKPVGARNRRRFVLYNSSSLFSVGVGVLCMYAMLFAFLLLGSLLILPPEFLGSQLNHSVGFMQYANLAWLASSMGMAAGAVGSSFDGADEVRKALYSEREASRRQQEDEGE